MKHRLFLLIAFLIFIYSPSLSFAESGYTNYSLMGNELKVLCENDPAVCELVIEGVIEGMEFAHILLIPSEVREKETLFCFEEEQEYLPEIRKHFMDFISKEENSSMLDQPAILSLAVALQPHQCR